MDAISFNKNNKEYKNGNSEDANMDSVSNSNNNNLSYQIAGCQSISMNLEPSIMDIKSMAVRKFIDSENEENLYVLPDGSMVVECIKTSKFKIISHSKELTVPLKYCTYSNESHQGRANYQHMQANSNNNLMGNFEDLKN